MSDCKERVCLNGLLKKDNILPVFVAFHCVISNYFVTLFHEEKKREE